MAKSKEIQSLIKQAECQGWQVLLTRGNHYKWMSPLGRFFFSASTPSDRRAIDNLKRDLARNGFVAIVKKERKTR